MTKLKILAEFYETHFEEPHRLKRLYSSWGGIFLKCVIYFVDASLFNTSFFYSGIFSASSVGITHP